MLKKLKHILVDRQILEHKEVLESYKDSDDCSFLFQNIVPKGYTKGIVNDEIFRDIEFEKLLDCFKCSTIGGKTMLEIILKHPISDIDCIKDRVSYIRSISETTYDLDVLKQNEQHMLWLFRDIDQNMKDLYNILYFRFWMFRGFNKSSSALTMHNIFRIAVSPMIGILSPIIYFIVPYLVICYNFGSSISFIEYIKFTFSIFQNSTDLFGLGKHLKYVSLASYGMSLLFYFQGLFNSIELSKTLYKIAKHVTNKVSGIVKYLNKTGELICHSNSIKFVESKDILETVLPELDDRDFGLFKHFGKQLKLYKSINKDVAKSMVIQSYVFDAVHAIGQFKIDKNYSYCGLLRNDKPIIYLEGMRHPCLKNPVNNDIKFFTNAIFTSGNSSGKSVTIKSILINTVLTQTCGITIANKGVTTVFDIIRSQINVPDATGYESLFEAEMHRCKENLIMLKQLPKDKLSLVVMDEIFNSTNPIEGIAGGYSICKKMSDYENNMLIFTTHLSYLTKLAKDTKKFINYRMKIDVLKDGKIDFTYKIEKGINKHYLALELLKLDGYDADIIDMAINIKNDLLMRT